jgi:uncharacterized protein HemY
LKLGPCTENLPEQHARSSWVLALLGKCHFELNQYRQAQDYFRQGKALTQSINHV